MLTLDLLKKQYHEMVAVLHVFEIHEPPSWEVVQTVLTSQTLLLATKITEPNLLLIPPLARGQMVQLIDKQIGRHGLKKSTFFDQPENNDLWSNGKPEELKWEIVIVDSTPSVALEPNIYWSGKPNESLSRTNQEQIILCINKYEQSGLDVLSDLRHYLTLMMLSLARGSPVDNLFSTILNSEVVVKDSKALLAQASWTGDSICLSSLYPFQSDDDLSLRAAIKLDF